MENINHQSPSKITWTPPDITVSPVSEITLGSLGFGGDFAAEIT